MPQFIKTRQHGAVDAFLQFKKMKQEQEMAAERVKRPSLTEMFEMQALMNSGVASPEDMLAYTQGGRQGLGQRMGRQPVQPQQIQRQQQAPSYGGREYELDPLKKSGVFSETPESVGAGKGIEKVAEIGTSGDAQIDYETKLQEAKEVSKTSTEMSSNTLRMMASSYTLLDTFLDRADDLQEKHGIKPGLGSGIMGKLAPQELDAYRDAFIGAGIENAAQVASVSIPSARAVRIVNVFAKSGPGEWSTIESGINNATATWKGAVAKDVVASPSDYGITDPKILNNRAALAAKANEIADKSAQEFKDGFLKKVYNKNPNLFSDRKERSRVGKLIEGESEIIGTMDKILSSLGV